MTFLTSLIIDPKKIGEKLHEVNPVTLRDSIVYS
uniref:Uncharacterized protein n=1 Tax=Candidatus Kentrum sp. DK TaxID=2126562 RepID=A0A450SY29_9GAMM|nr:MAG: hypothetical protein BECKDK2373C_GA0170839_106918 [Candidatus Kentron sp. DK]